jgi:stress response protein YsnF
VGGTSLRTVKVTLSMTPQADDKSPVRPDASHDEATIPLLSEDVAVSTKKATTVLRVATVTKTREQLVDEPVKKEWAEVDRVPIGRYVDAVPEVREEGDLVVVPVVEEVVVLTRRLRLKEEVRIRRVRRTERYTETVRLREQDAVVTRHPASEPGRPAGPSSAPAITENEG